MRTADDVRSLLDECLARARNTDLAATQAAPGGETYQRLATEHLVWVNVAQALRWVLDELRTFEPVQLDQS
jgi:hypothetical protein